MNHVLPVLWISSEDVKQQRIMLAICIDLAPLPGCIHLQDSLNQQHNIIQVIF